MISIYSSLNRMKTYSIGQTLIPLLISSENHVVIYEEYPRLLIRVFNLESLQMKCFYLPRLLVDMCYSQRLNVFVFLSEKFIYTFDPFEGLIERMNDYDLLKENRSMSSICSMNDERLLILYRFGEYLDIYPKGKRIWKRRHLCESLTEDIAQIRSTKECLIGLLIVEWNGIWRVDIFSSTLHKLHRGFRFTNWTIQTRLSDWSIHQLWFVGNTHQVMIDSKGQPRNILSQEKDSNVLNITWANSDRIVTQSRTLLTFFRYIDYLR